MNCGSQVLRQTIPTLLEEIGYLRATIQDLLEQNARLGEENKELSDRLLQLEEQLKVNSSNSSKPPSQDPFRKARQSQLSGKKPGGQLGHPGHARKMVPLDQIARTIEIRSEICPRCGTEISETDSIAVRHHQVVELALTSPEVTQYNIHTCKCRRCGKRVKALPPKEAIKGFGPRLMAFLTMLCGEAHVTKRKICRIMSHLGIQISLGAVCNIHRLAGLLLKKTFEEIRAAALQSPNLNADESHWRCKRRKYWLWTGATSTATFFCIDPSRSQASFERIFGGFRNTLSTDRYGAYNLYSGDKQTCLAHIRRDLIKMSERPGADGAIGRILNDQLSELFGLWHQYKDRELSRIELQQQAQKPIENFKLALTVGATAEGLNSKSIALCNDLLSRFETLWTFLFQDGVEPTNNLAERSLRPAIIYRKLTGGSQSDWGMIFVERLLTVTCTFRQRAKNIFTFLIGTFRAHVLGESTPPAFEF